MKTKQPWLLTSLLLSASQSVRQLLGQRPSELHGARADVLSFRDVSTYDQRGRLEPRYLLDALIEPASPDTAWQPSELTLLPTGAAETIAEDGENVGDLCRILSTEVLEARRFQPASDRVCTGRRRVRLDVRVRPGLAQLCFRHGTALFGCVVLPDAAAFLAI